MNEATPVDEIRVFDLITMAQDAVAQMTRQIELFMKGCGNDLFIDVDELNSALVDEQIVISYNLALRVSHQSFESLGSPADIWPCYVHPSAECSFGDMKERLEHLALRLGIGPEQ